ncbi:lipopolysaccharide biosynthesis protein [Paenibacillus sp. HW567]|uniref:lipopolysaccharide biosynthesis protein n=1 Tax=Paenibacillus sp. HW567 TaxID=1034769 RepID=UPI00037433B3|nr:hypothetical protein [Paenibacillus sp. HW567]
MRVNNSIKNILTGILLQLVAIGLNIFSRKVFLDFLGVEILGVHGVLTNLISMLGLMEMGIGIAISYSLYKPLSEDNQDQIKAIINLYANFYKVVALAVLVIGLLIIPFMDKIVESSYTTSYVRIIFLILLIDAMMSYFLAYRRTLLLADQKSFTLNKLTIIYSIVLTVSQVSIVFLTQNFILFISIKLIFGVGLNLIIYYITNKNYPYLKSATHKMLDPDIKGNIIQNIKALLLANISVYFIYGTDNLLLSIFTNVSIVGIYSNYTLIFNAVKGFLSQIFVGTTASFGNLLASSTGIDEADRIFKTIFFINFWLTTFCSSALLLLINPFINIWIGSSMLLSGLVIVILVSNFYLDTMRSAVELVKSAAGLYSPYPFFKYWIVVEALINLFLAVFLAGILKMGMLGIFLATSISTLLPTYIMPWNIYKYVFRKSSKQFYLKHFVYNFSSVIVVGATYMIGTKITLGNLFIDFFFKIIICIFTPNLMLLVFCRTKEFIYLKERIQKRIRMGTKFKKNI